MNLSSQSYKGARDYYPEDKRKQNYIFDTWRQVSELFGYEEYGAPILEPLELYAAKSGQELVNEQTYAFTDRGGRSVAIRPEMTPTISRMVASKRQELNYPTRLYSIANFMRYERPQRGREREFWQLNVDMFGADGVASDVEIISLADAVMRKFGADPAMYTIRINERSLIKYVMNKYLNLDDDRAQDLTKLFDRRAKISSDEFEAQLAEILIDKEKVAKATSLLEIKSIDDLPSDLQKVSELQSIKYVIDELAQLGITNAVFDLTLMRGLDYYTGIVFEVFDNHPDNNRSLFGGGRYDGLVELFGVEPITAIGFGMGGTTIENFLNVHDLWPELEVKTDIYLAVVGSAYRQAMQLATYLRQNGVKAEVEVIDRKLDKQIKSASKKAIGYALVVSEEDYQKDRFSMKNLANGEIVQVNKKDILNLLSDD